MYLTNESENRIIRYWVENSLISKMPENGKNSQENDQKWNKAQRAQQCVHLQSLSANGQKMLKNKRLEKKSDNSMGHDQKLIGPEGFHNEFTQWNWSKSTETAWPIWCQEWVSD